jgi:hypothetical protein
MLNDLQNKIKNNVKIDNNGCWIWQRETHKGYGRIYFDGKRMRAHRASYMAFNGELQEDMSVCHSCDNPTCVNPEHLWLGSHSENMRDGYRKGRVRLPWQKFTAEDVLEIRRLWATGDFTQKQLAEKFNTSAGYIKVLVNRRAWQHL